MTTRKTKVDGHIEPKAVDHEGKHDDEDIAGRRYYYDDAHGYQEFDPDDDSDEGTEFDA